MIKILLGNSSCAKWGTKDKKHNGEGYELFENFRIAKDKFCPDFFVYENNPLASKPIQDYIETQLGVSGVLLNANNISAQNRERLYYTNINIPSLPSIDIKFADILDKFDEYQCLSNKAMAYMCRPTKGGRNQFQYNYWSTPINTKSKCLTSSAYKGIPYDVVVQPYSYQCNNSPYIDVVNNRIVDSTYNNIKSSYINIQNGKYIVRHLTKAECCRLQGYCDDYCKAISTYQAKRSLGATWHYNVLLHILSAMLYNVNTSEDILVVSLYDGIGGGRHALQQLGYTNVEYYSYESNNYSLQVALDNYNDIIPKGDALSIRHSQWDIHSSNTQSYFIDNTPITSNMTDVNYKHTMSDLIQMQSLPLEAKIILTKNRIKEWHDHWTENGNGCHVSFSGGKDSTVLKHLVDSMYNDVPSVFVDTGLEYPEIRKFVQEIKDGKYDKFNDNVIILKPYLKFNEVILQYGYPIISKEISGVIDNTRNVLINHGVNQLSDLPSINTLPHCVWKMLGRLGTKSNLVDANASFKERSKYNCDNYQYILNAPFKVSDKCCDIMKKRPIKIYEKQHNSHPLLGLTVEESQLRLQTWLRAGCNSFSKRPRSMPLAFWTEQDILEYIIKYNVPIADVYGEIIYMDKGWETTGVDRTGCMFCMFGAHLEKSPNRFERMKTSHPKQYEYCMKSIEEGGLGLKDVIDWINNNSDGKTKIEY